MSRTKVQAFDEVIAPDDIISPAEVQRNAGRALREFFPPRVIVSLLAVFWTFVLPPVMVLITSSFVGGGVSGLMVILYTWLGLLLFETYTSPVRTIVWAIVMSFALGLISLYWLVGTGFESSAVTIPVLLFVTLRINMNGRKLLILLKSTRRNAKAQEQKD